MPAVSKADGRLVEIDGAPLFLYDLGSGPALVLLHGGGPGATAWINWKENLEALSARFRVIAPDLPGFGQSSIDGLEGGYLSFAAGKVARLLDALGIDGAHFVGNSLGGGTALTFALEHPGRTGRLILLNPAGSPGSLFQAEPSAELKMLMTYYDEPGASLERMQAFCEEMVFDPACLGDGFLEERYQESIIPGRREGQRAATRGLKSQEADLGSGALWLASAKVTSPTLLLWGREDRAAALDKGLMWLKRMPDASLHIVPNCGHWIQMEHVATFNRLCLDFLGA